MEFYNKHYIRLDENGNVVKAFSDVFEQPLETDICVSEEGGRHFNPNLFYEDGCPMYKGNMELRTDEENFEWRKKPIDILKYEKRSEINEICKQKIEEGFIFENNPYTFRSIPDQDNIMQLDKLFEKDPTLITGWRTANDETVIMDKDKFDEFSMTAQMHKMTQLSRAWELKDALKFATTKEEIDLIVW